MAELPEPEGGARVSFHVERVATEADVERIADAFRRKLNYSADEMTPIDVDTLARTALIEMGFELPTDAAD